MHGVTKEVTLDAEVFGVTTNPFSKMPSTGRELTGKIRLLEVTLEAKLGDRAVLEVRQGLPVPVRAPG